MTVSGRSQHRFRLTATLLIGSLALGGCTPEKARALQGAVVQFKIESLAAIEDIEEMHRRELAPPPRPESEVRESFIRNVLNYNESLNPEIVELALDPDAVALNPQSQAQWNAFMDDLRTQYSTFAGIFDDLESGSFVAAEAVKSSAEHAQMLTLQMAAFAAALDKNPPILIQYRSAIVTELDALREQYQKNQRQIRRARSQNNSATLERLQANNRELEQQTGVLMDRWKQVKADEQELLQTTMAQCLKTATLGKDLTQLINTYETLNLNDINSAVAGILNTVAGITGRDYNSLRARSATVLNAIQESPVWSGVANTALSRVSAVVANRTALVSGTIPEITVPPPPARRPTSRS
ncbi:hypothetical protein [Leptolyngbya sp. FACHB-261]|uniref:hypothetical protein n=1 Tax=Leptolyngbya sp. FACHB-261 TaxID=2692806 RepID=UPI0016855358|nr:hypothetical protein [Leptolyngbya sp. FACHB-261]MBD2100804.1 hypothetical protein [Leptolyngbya sp. FACHB-261]